MEIPYVDLAGLRRKKIDIFVCLSFDVFYCIKFSKIAWLVYDIFIFFFLMLIAAIFVTWHARNTPMSWIFLSLGYWTLNFHLEQLKNPCLKCMVLTPSFPPLEYPHYADFLWLKYSCSWQLPATRYGMCHHRTIGAWWKFAYLWSCTWRNSKVVVTYRCSLSEKIGKPPCNHQDLSQKPIYC